MHRLSLRAKKKEKKKKKRKQELFYYARQYISIFARVVAYEYSKYIGSHLSSSSLLDRLLKRKFYCLPINDDEVAAVRDVSILRYTDKELLE